MDNKEQIQKAGNNSQQLQIGNLDIHLGITEQRAREIYSEMSMQARKENTIEAETIANSRIDKLESILIPRIEKEDHLFECFADPSFQILLKKAQLTMACSERDIDCSILSELLTHRVKNKTNTKKKASISKAVEIIDQIDDDSLLALTVFMLMDNYVPSSGNVKNGLSAIDYLYGKFELDKLPHGVDWQDNLSILDSITLSMVGNLKKFEQYFSENLPGYVCAGIKKDSEDYQKSLQLLSKCRMSGNFLEDNDLLPGYVRIPVSCKEVINKLHFDVTINDNGRVVVLKQHLIEKDQIECLNSIFEMYSKDKGQLDLVKSNFTSLLHSYASIHKAVEWWNSLSCAISLTSVGKVIAHTYAKSISSELPDLD